MSSRAIAGLVLLLVLISGCSQEQGNGPPIASGYGRSTGNGYVDSLNGTAVLLQMFRENGNRVERANTISPKIDRCDHIVWFRDRFDAPPEEAIERLDKWLNGNGQHTLIVVGRDGDSAISYWEQVVKNASIDRKVQAKRRLSEVKSEFYQRRSQAKNQKKSCTWCRIEKAPYQTVTELSGPWAKGVKGPLVDFNIGDRMIARTQSSDSRFARGKRATSLLKANGKTIVSSLDASYDYGSLVFVSNGMFVTNYGLVNPEHQKLAANLLPASTDQRVLFLETGLEARVVGEADNHSKWAWITEPPLKYIVPHFLLLGLFFCFVLFPIFGRPKKQNRDSEVNNFRMHIKAMGKLLAKSGKRGIAQSKIQKYLNRK